TENNTEIQFRWITSRQLADLAIILVKALFRFGAANGSDPRPKRRRLRPKGATHYAPGTFATGPAFRKIFLGLKPRDASDRSNPQLAGACSGQRCAITTKRPRLLTLSRIGAE